MYFAITNINVEQLNVMKKYNKHSFISVYFKCKSQVLFVILNKCRPFKWVIGLMKEQKGDLYCVIR